MADMPPSRMPSLGEEPPRFNSPPHQQQASNQVPYVLVNQPKHKNRSIALWVIFSMIIGFLLPVCLVAILCISAFIGIGQLAGDIDPEEGPAIGVIELTGPIYGGSGPDASEDNMLAQIEYMEENRDVKAIVVKANSPGGDANASDQIWYALSQVDKPVVISMQGLCASGCLYISSAGDEIYATRNSLVGSIGVISTFFNAEELLDDIGVEVTIVATGESKDFGSVFRSMTQEEQDYWQTQLESVLDNFITVVANRPNSSLSRDDVHSLATGEVWSASNAEQLGLIDQLGYEDDAIERAADLAGISNYRVHEYPFNFDFANIFANSNLLNGDIDSIFAVPNTDDLLNSLQQPSIQYRYFGPYNGASNEYSISTTD